jgi:nitrogenase cofactor biosynthesis protein NifB
MATHYNEPVDIASSSLTEEGTVYGGEKNLLQGLLNLIRVYHPEVIGVATTCLAETIGEDIGRMIERFYEEHPEHKDITIIKIPSAGYKGTQYEGFMTALYHIVKTVPMNPEKHSKVNIITGQLSPADTRYLKELLAEFGIEYILLPDLSENLDGGHLHTYSKLPQEGTDIRMIEKMAGARMTIEITISIDEKNSAAKYLYDTYDVPYIRCNLPVGLRDNDEFLRILAKVSGNAVPLKTLKERERYIDAMIDSHKYNGEARVAIYGEPDFVVSTARMCVENGIMPMITATGSKYPKLRELLEQEIMTVSEAFFIDDYKIIEDVDFQTIEEYARDLKVNLLIGNSDGRRISETLEIPLVRRGFPIHDRMGGQRLRMFGYEGALTLIDEITNEILGRKERTFRENLYQQYYIREESSTQISEEAAAAVHNWEGDDSMENELVKRQTIEEKTAKHPCYNCQAHQYARIHLPIAPKCNISCNYCLRKYDCPNESRPGVTTAILSPKEAFLKFMEVKTKVPNLSVVGIAGPGDALANFTETKALLTLIRKEDKDITFCLSTNGLMLPQYANELIALGVSHVTVTMNAIDPKIGAQIYKYVDYMGTKYYGETAAAILLSNQLAGIRMLTEQGIICKVNIVMLKGINDHHIPEVVAKVKELGGVITNIMQMIPVKGSVFEELPLVTNKEIMQMRVKCGEIMKQMYHCKQCRADAIGTLDSDRSSEFQTGNQKEAPLVDKEYLDGMDSENPSPRLPEEAEASQQVTTPKLYMAVATKSGIIVDQHFGQVSEFYVYEYTKGNAVFKEKRPVNQYCKGSAECGEGTDKMDLLIQTIADCDAVIAMRIGDGPKVKLGQKGIKTFTTYDKIEASVLWAANEIKKLP